MAHLVWDWNGTLLDDLTLVVTATNASLASLGIGPVSADDHRRDFRRPVSDYYAYVLGRPVDFDEFARLDGIYHDAYRRGLIDCTLAADAEAAIRAWEGTQSVLSMWFHHELVPELERRGLYSHFDRVDGLRAEVGGGFKAEHLVEHLAELGVDGSQAVLIGDSVDDADAADAVGARCVLYGGGFTDAARLVGTGKPVATTLLDAVDIAKGLVDS